MAKVTRSGRKLKDDDSNNSRRRQMSVSTTDTSGLRRSTREMSSKKQSASSSSNTRKSERVGKLTPQTPPTKRKSERVENQSMPSPLRRSNRNDKRHSLDFSTSEKLDKGSGSSVTKKGKEKREENEKNMKLDAVVCTTKKRKDLKPVRAISKKKRLDARSYRAFLKPQGSKAKEPDFNQTLKAHGASENGGGIGCKEVDCSDGKGEELRGEDLGEGYKIAIEGSDSGLKEVEDEGECSEGKGKEVRGRDLGEGCIPVIKGTNSSCKEGEDEGECNEGMGVEVRDNFFGEGRKRAIGGSTSGSQEVDDEGECSERKGEEVREKDLREGCKRAIEGSTSGSRKLVKGIPKKHGEIELSYFSRKRKNRLEEARETKTENRSPVSKNGDGSLQSPRHAVKAKEEIAGADSMQEGDCSKKSESIGSPSEGKSVTYNHDLERAGKVGALKRKRLDMDFNASIMKDSEKICTSTAHAVLLSSSGSKEINFEVCEQSSSVRSPQTGEMSVNCIQKDGTKLDTDLIDQQREEAAGLDGSVLLPDDGRKAVHDHTDLPGRIEISIPLVEDGMELEASVGRVLTEKCCNGAQLTGSSLDLQSEGDQNACVVCKLGGKILCCDGKGCKKSYHLYCLDPPLQDVPPSLWYCLSCVKKKMELGVHSVSGGLESIWDAKEVKLSDSEGIQKQYLVKYQGLAHVHNCWVPESQLLLDSPALVARFKKNQVRRWRSEWTVPHRLLQKRLLMSPKQRNEYLGGHTYKTKKEMKHLQWLSSHISNCHYEWFVKWKGLGYEHATWELENEHFFQSPEILTLMKDYENRHKKAKLASEPSIADKVLQEKSGPCFKLSKLPVQSQPGSENDHLCFVNKLRDRWHKGQNAVVMEDQERIVKVILFILSLQSNVCRPFLIISTSTALSAWETEFARLAPSVNLVVYNGNKDTRETIRMLEFYEECGSTMFQVLLSYPEAIVEDLKVLECLGWEAIVVDECQRSSVTKHFEQIKVLTTDFKVLLVSGPIKDSLVEYINLLSFIDSGVDGSNTNNLKIDFIDNIGKLKERFARFVATGRKSDSSQFVEYWVPVRLSNVQLEQYCATLLSNSISLRSCSKHDPVGALRDILISTRKCCDHPYIVDPSLQSLITKGLPEAEYLDVGVNASGKLQILDKILSEILKQGLRALILFQSIGGTGRNYIGDILDDFLRQRFGPDSYERVDSGLLTSKKQTALNMFNNKERGRFVFLIENRACLPSIKLSSVDIVILFDSDWNPLNDLRALQKITIDSECEQIKVFRLYSSCTLEEKVLLLAKQDMTLDSSVQNINCSTSHMLLKWGASYLFKKLDEFHGCTPSSGSIISSEQSLLNDVVQELLAQLPLDAGKSNTHDSSIILRVKQSGLTYSSDISLLGELEMQSSDEEQPHVFWTRLLEGRCPQWRFLSEPSQRVRKKVQYFDESQNTSDVNNDDIIKKRKKIVSNTFDPTSLKSGVEDYRKVVHENNEGASDPPASNGFQLLPRSKANMDAVCYPNVNLEVPETHMVESEERKHFCDSQKNLHLFLKPEISKLCEILQLPEDIKGVTGKFLEYIMNNHHVSREPVTILQAFQISLCWTAASLLKQKINRKETLALAKQHLNFECKDEEAEFVYSRLRKLKKMFSRRTENAMESSSAEDTARTKDGAEQGKASQLAASGQQEMEDGEIRESSQSQHSPSQQIAAKQEQAPDSEKVNGSPKNDTSKSILQVKKIHSARMRKILDKQMDEIMKFNEKYRQVMEKLKGTLEKEHKIESALIRAMHSQISVRSDKLKTVDRNFARKMEEFSSHIEKQQKRLEAMQLAVRIEEKRRMSHWLEEAKSGRPVASFSMLPLPDSGFRFEDMESSNQVGVSDGPEKVTPISGPSSEKQDTDGTGIVMPGEIVVTEAPKIARNEAVEGVIFTEPLDFSVQSGNQNDAMACTMTSDREIVPRVVQHGDRIAGTSDSEGSPSLEQTRLSSPLDKDHISTVQDSGVPSFQELPVEETQLFVSGGLQGEDLSSCELQNSSLQIEVSLLHPPTDPSSSEQNQPGATACTVVEHSANHERLTASVQFQLPAQPPVQNQAEKFNHPVSLHPPTDPSSSENNQPGTPAYTVIEDSTNHERLTVFAQFQPPAEPPVQNQAEQFNHSASLHPLTNPSSSENNHPGTPAYTVIEDTVNHEKHTVSVQFQLPAEPPVLNQAEQFTLPVSLYPPSDPSSSEHNRPGEPACTVIEHTVNPESLTASAQVQLPAQPPVQDQSELFNDSVPQLETRLELQHSSSHTSSQQAQVATQPSAEDQAELFNLPALQSETQLEHDHLLRPTPSQQAQVQIQLPESEVSTRLVRDQVERLTIPQPETQLERGHLLRNTSSQQVQLQTQPPAEVYAELHNVLQSNTQLQMHTSIERSSSGSGIRMPESRSLGVVPESSNRLLPTASVTPRISQPFQPDPLQTELARIRKEEDQVVKIHEDLKIRINSECEKEIEEICRKYSTLRQDAETAFMQKRKALETFHNKVYMNRVLAEVFRFKCSEPRAAGALGLQQGVPPGFMQQLLQMSSMQNAQRPISAPGPPAAPSSASPIQVVRHSSALFSSNPVRPHYSSVGPSTGNYQVGGEMRTPATHLQSVRSSTSMSVPNHHSFSNAMPSQQSPSIPAAASMLPHLTARPHTSLTAGGLSVPRNSSSAHELARSSIDNGPSLNPPNLFTPLPDLGLAFDTYDRSELATNGTLRGPAARVGISADVVCLSDDD